ncbi:MAG: hypothetical protein LAO78_26500 [Acidobacteriia bacterium]|nr:hypothetical protein [Terriglobia bacterium]
MASLPQIRERLLVNIGRCRVMSPEGVEIEVPSELFLALSDFMVTRKNAGSMIVHFRNGGVAGLETLVKKKYK